MARYTESHHIIIYGEVNSKSGLAPDYDNNPNVLSESCNEDVVINKYSRKPICFLELRHLEI